jgi:hypothetical protein
MPVWYFFSPVRYVRGRRTNARGEPGRRSRTIKGAAGTGKHWHSEKGERPVKGGSDYGGYEQYFSYKVKNPSSGKDERGGWIMWEYGISPEHGGGDLVLCKIYPSFHAVAPEAGEPVSDPDVIPKKRKTPAGDHPEDPTVSARRRLTDEHPMLVDSLESDLTWVDESVLDQDAMTEWYGAANLTGHQSTFEAAPPCQNVEDDCWGSYHNDDWVMPEGDLPCAPGAQLEPEEDDAGFLQHTYTEDLVPRQNYNDECQMYASLGEEEQPLLVESKNYDDMTPPVDEDETARPEDLMADFQMNFPQLFLTEEPEMMYGAAGFADQAAPLSNFFENVEQDFWSEYQKDAMMPVGDLAVPAAQPEDDAAATGLVQTVTAAGEVPRQNSNDDGQMYASLGEEQPEHDTTASGEAIFGLPCPAEMTRRCKDDLTMPWQSPSSTPMMFGLY